MYLERLTPQPMPYPDHPVQMKAKKITQDMTMIPEHTFIRVFDADSPSSLEHWITKIQMEHASLMEHWEETFLIEAIQTPTGPF